MSDNIERQPAVFSQLRNIPTTTPIVKKNMFCRVFQISSCSSLLKLFNFLQMQHPILWKGSILNRIRIRPARLDRIRTRPPRLDRIRALCRSGRAHLNFGNLNPYLIRIGSDGIRIRIHITGNLANFWLIRGPLDRFTVVNIKGHAVILSRRYYV